MFQTDWRPSLPNYSVQLQLFSTDTLTMEDVSKIKPVHAPEMEVVSAIQPFIVPCTTSSSRNENTFSDYSYSCSESISSSIESIYECSGSDQDKNPDLISPVVYRELTLIKTLMIVLMFYM